MVRVSAGRLPPVDCDPPCQALVLLPGAAAAVARLNRLGMVILVTNQSGIGRGYMTREVVDAIHEDDNSRKADAGKKRPRRQRTTRRG